MDDDKDISEAEAKRLPAPVSGLDRTIESGSAGPATKAPQMPQRIGEFAIVDELGAGGMGRVYVAHDADLDRKVAIKVLHPCEDAQAQQARNARFLREAQGLARVSHPNVVAVYEIGIDDGAPFIVMELVVGGSLRQWQRTPHSWQDIARIYAQAGRGITACHDANLVHRDIKPDNILLDDTMRPRVSDFGLVGAVSATDGVDAREVDVHGPLSATLTNVGDALGTLAYMPPEQLIGQPVDARADQFAFAVALFEALHGERPFPGTSAPALLEAIDTDDRKPLREDLPVALRDGLARALSANRDDRFASLAELLDVIDTTVDTATATAPATRRRWLVPVVAASVAAVALAVTFATGALGRSEMTVVEPYVEEPPVVVSTSTSTPTANHAKVKRLEERVNALETVAAEHAMNNRGKQAIKAQQEAIAMVDGAKLSVPGLRARLLINLGDFQTMVGDNVDAKANYERAVTLMAKLETPDIEVRASAHESLGALAYEGDRPTEAEAQFRQALVGYTKGGGRDPSELARMNDNLAMALVELKRVDEAEKLLRVALALRVKGKLDKELMNSYSRFAQLYMAKGDKVRAAKYRKMAADKARSQPD